MTRSTSPTAPSKAEPHLRRALEKPGQHREAFLALLEAWRAERAPELAQLIEQRSKVLSRGRVALDPADPQAFHRAWLDLERKGDALDIPALLIGLHHPPLGAHIRARIERLVLRPDDPRLTIGFLDLSERPVTTSSANFPLWTQVFKKLEQLADVRARARLETARSQQRGRTGFERMLEKRIDRLLGALDFAPPKLDSESTALLEALSGQRSWMPPASKSPRSGDQTRKKRFFAVFESPAEDAPKAVLADWLIEQGDPRGRFIALQLQGGPQKEANALLKQHERAWLGQLEQAVDRQGVRFQKGFLSSCRVRFSTPAQKRSLLLAPELSTIEALYTLDPELMKSELLTSLTTLSGVDLKGYAEMQSAKTLRHLRRLSLWIDQDRPSDFALFDAPVAPQLAEMQVQLTHPIPMLSSTEVEALARMLPLQLRALRLLALPGSFGRRGGPQPPLLAWQEVLKTRPALKTIQLDSHAFWFFRFQRGPQGVELIAQTLRSQPDERELEELLHLLSPLKGTELTIHLEYPFERRAMVDRDAFSKLAEGLAERARFCKVGRVLGPPSRSLKAPPFKEYAAAERLHLSHRKSLRQLLSAQASSAL